VSITVRLVYPSKDGEPERTRVVELPGVPRYGEHIRLTKNGSAGATTLVVELVTWPEGDGEPVLISVRERN
jgi:hypothetical protein